MILLLTKLILISTRLARAQHKRIDRGERLRTDAISFRQTLLRYDRNFANIFTYKDRGLVFAHRL